MADAKYKFAVFANSIYAGFVIIVITTGCKNIII